MYICVGVCDGACARVALNYADEKPRCLITGTVRSRVECRATCAATLCHDVEQVQQHAPRAPASRQVCIQFEHHPTKKSYTHGEREFCIYYSSRNYLIQELFSDVDRTRRLGITVLVR